MTDNTFTDEEIIKALECCSKHNYCNECPNIHTLCEGDSTVMVRLALDLINRQRKEIENLNKDLSDTIALNHEEQKVLKAEIERLVKGFKEVKKGIEEVMALVAKDIAKAKAEADKEFAERLCEGRVSNDPVVIAVKAELKGMVGEGNERT